METPSEKPYRAFALILINHRIWGQILLPYIIIKEPSKSYFRISECLFPFPNIDTLSALAQEERDVVNIINEYSERTLFKLFSKDKNVKEFQTLLTKEKLEKFIRPYIERRIYKSLEISRNENIPVYFQKTKTGTLHPEDRLSLSAENAIPVFSFVREEDCSTYNLSLEAGGKPIDLRNNSVDIICMSPCLIRESNRLFFVTEVDGSKLKPFITKDFIVIPKKTEVKYFSSFVVNAINNFKVEGRGFEIEEPGAEKEACLEISNGIRGNPVIILRYSYQGHFLYANDPDSSFTVFNKKGDNFIFYKYHRDFVWEKRCRDILGELGYFSDDDINFLPLYGDSVNKDKLFSLIEHINRSYSDITNAGFRLTSKLNENYNLKQVNIEISSQLENDWFDIKAIVSIGEWNLPFTLFRKNIIGGIREYRLPDGTIAILPETWFTRYKNIFEFGKSTDSKLKIHKQHFALLKSTLSDDTNEGFEKLEKLLKPDQISLINSPSGLKVKMRQYQSDG